MSKLPKLALSIRQPWAYSIIYLGKNIENRNWFTNFRGEICIHAAKSMTRYEWEDCADTVERIGAGFIPEFADFKKIQGGIVGTATVIDCLNESNSPWFFGKYGLVLDNVKPVDFIPCKGALGFFDWRKLNGASND